MFSNDRNQLRQVFFDAWRKHSAGDALQPLEEMVATVIQQHPEYHRLLNDREQGIDKDYLPEGGETNPFLHMAMHLTLIEQVSTDRPPGISGLYQRFCQRKGDTHEVEHQLMECLGRILWEAQVEKRMPDEQAYFECVERLVES
ncbi:MAG: DUF1841 family protein [Candidatus Thiodiazotropha taylori]|uniref:DUF1841 family protein n=1 Tax=Candidatus Thiodiazotropha taylori TaxID=2792791 RepID=A0A9E4KAX8_9GAMM|nr:DUF1841 family protein [Candidatus Thiodiazotropha taylori]RLW68899.1 MAG: hypothetical protein B6D71_12225 [gamma proteobacterium symbiont of Stewartia floridana]MCG8051550.1 DUF1841 family protein [Candidatus Thiodiazotropha taylori]MCG8099016.1 DUF1841 family protein [Candidatus Thiodiazotropha taylori]MCW4255756.1 DUF1841 family protein [Candidatus Thiodiazotropha taylori]